MLTDEAAPSSFRPIATDMVDDFSKISAFGMKGEEDSWQFTYLDVITLLFATFVLLLALYGNQVSKQRAVLEGMKANSALQLWKISHPSIAVSEKSTGPLPTKPERTKDPAPIHPEETNDPVPIIPETKAESTISAAEQSTLDDISERVKAQGLGEMVTVESQKEGLIITMKETLLFPSGQAVLSEQGASWIRGIAPAIQSDATLISVEGHTDNVPIHNERFPSNWELSAGRASSVVRELITAGIPSDKLRAIGYADSRPVAYNAFPSGREQNRRVQIKLNFSGKEKN